MDLKVDVYFTLALAAALLVLGARIVGRVPFLSRYSIPEAVVGGLLAAALLTAGRAANLRIEFDDAIKTPFNILFFTTVGLAADVRSVIKGGRMLALFFVSVLGVLVLQNVIGGALALAFGIHPANGLIAGSITLVGGHGTGAAWGKVFVDKYQLKGAMELAVACATYGLVAGGLLGGPFARWLIQRHQIPGSGIRASDEPAAEPQARQELAASTLVNTLLLMFVAMAVGFLCTRAYGSGRNIPVPTFIWALACGAILRNVLSLTRLYQVDDRAVELLGSLSLSLFLSMAIMSLKLWELVDLAIPVIVILAVQTASMLAYTAVVSFRMLGRNYDAVLLSTGQIGFGLGSTATAIAGMKSVSSRYGHSPLAFLLVPVMGAFLIDLANALVIQGFLTLPGFK
jgi:ESS family glutamate:Na+ symporter